MAGLIPQHFIDELLERSDILDVIGSRVALKKTGRNFSARCPFHQEKTPSFSVNQEKQFYYCFGCGAGGNSVQFVMDFEHIDFPQAIEQLARQHGLDVPHEKSPNRPQQPREDNSALYKLMEDISAFFQQQLHGMHGVAVLAYLQQRNINKASINSFELGYAPDTWDALIKKFGQSEADIQVLFKTGMLVHNEDNNKIYDRFRNRLIFPIRDRRGRIVGFGGRTLGNDKAKYINSPETTLFHKSKELYGLYQARRQPTEPEYILICEGYADVIALHQHGIHNAVATLGTATNEEHLKILFRYCPTLIFSFDGDTAGQRAAQRAFQVLLPLLEDGLSVKFLFLPAQEDPDSLINAHGKAGFMQYIRDAKTFNQYFFELLIPENVNPQDLALKARLSQRTLPLIQKIPGRAYQQLLLQELQQHTGLQKDTLFELFEEQILINNKGSYIGHTQRDYSEQNNPSQNTPKYEGTKQAAFHKVQPKQRQMLKLSQKTLRLTPEKRALSLLLNHPILALEIDLTNLPKVSNDQSLLTEVIAYIQQNPDQNNHRLLGHWLNHTHKTLLLHLLAEAAALNLDTSASRIELQDCIIHLGRTQQTHANKTLLENMAQQRSASFAQLDPELQQQIQKIQNTYKDPQLN